MTTPTKNRLCCGRLLLPLVKCDLDVVQMLVNMLGCSFRIPLHFPSSTLVLSQVPLGMFASMSLPLLLCLKRDTSDSVNLVQHGVEARRVSSFGYGLPHSGHGYDWRILVFW